MKKLTLAILLSTSGICFGMQDNVTTLLAQYNELREQQAAAHEKSKTEWKTFNKEWEEKQSTIVPPNTSLIQAGALIFKHWEESCTASDLLKEQQEERLKAITDALEKIENQMFEK